MTVSPRKLAQRSWRRQPCLWAFIVATVMVVFLLFLSESVNICTEGFDCHDFFKLKKELKNKIPSFKSTEPIDFKSMKTISFKNIGGANLFADHPDATCDKFPETSNILLVMKTGASEAYAKIPTQLMTNLKCLDDFLIFSDMEQTVAGHKILDSLDNVLPEAKIDNPDFDLYNRQKNCRVGQETCNKGSSDDTASQGWALDKYKNIHMAEKAYHKRPEYDWYMYVDADTYVIWPTLVDYLKTFDPKEKLYLGSVALIGDFPFAHGGSGYVVSQGMMQEFFQDKKDVARKWDMSAKDTCCGDFLFAYALKRETNMTVSDVVSCSPNGHCLI